MLAFSTFPFKRRDDNTFIVNLSSFYEGYPRLNALDPLNYYNVGVTNEYNFDVWYAFFILNTPDSFKQFLDLMINVYNGKDVIVLNDPRITYSTTLVESLIKLITERYGYISNIVNDPDDIPFIKDSSFSTEGLFVIDSDIQVYRERFGCETLESEPYDNSL
jgi:hypothetical protein